MKRILIVDDEPQVSAALRRLFRREGFESTAAEDGAQALALLDELRPDLVLTDFRMPGMDGMQLLDAIQARYPGVPGVVVSGHVDPELLEGKYPFVPKPWDERELLALVRRLLGLSAP